MSNDCKLVSVDIDSDITETFRLCLENEQNTRNIEIVNNDIFKYNPTIKFDIITMIGSAVQEIGFYKEIFKKATSMLSDKGELFYSCVTKEETKEQLIDALARTGAFVVDYLRFEKYGLVLIVSKIIREH